METRRIFEVKALRAQRLNISKRPKSAHISHRGELVLGLSPRANRVSYGVSDSPTKYQAESRHRVVQRYCVLDHTTAPPRVDNDVSPNPTPEGFKSKIVRAGNLLPRQPTVKSIRQPSLHPSAAPPTTASGPSPDSPIATMATSSSVQNDDAVSHNETHHEGDSSTFSVPSPPHITAWTEAKPPRPKDSKAIDDAVTTTTHDSTDAGASPSKISTSTPSTTPVVVAPTAALCLSAYQARKQAEESARLLANRLSFLHMEKSRAEQEAERLQVEFYREKEAKLAFERQRQERAARADQERQRVAAKHSKALALQSQNRSNVQQQALNVAQQKRQAAVRVRQQQKELEEDKKAREATMMQEKLRAKNSVVCHHERSKRQRELRERHHKERLERAQAERLRKELEGEKMAKHLVAKMQAQEHTLKTMLEFQEHQHRIDMQRCFDMETYAVPDQLTPSS
ncbi:hypothetical protein H310_11261 [Aphanomyces invadans]|uniref:Uncharacterized protein n=1 Tax=Aphanomyces invadans TaxID=157072 RepID=A0A024TN13_9STRA|nr:hypothetical protein H310_11261 [Aphanomyces invadans]ETV95379.1 hypothetical protein H310_11261 [Aphanomyces invadans]|eukprot:XP_008876080.1 hypothetical protein H310_11261 [Aphanomyces invadans]